jgi:chromosome partitioning protein
MRRIVIINPKGGCGKTTIAINLASFYAARGDAPVLMDYDPQGSATRWFRKRGLGAFTMHGVAAFERDLRTTRTFRLRVPPLATRVVIDTPAALDAQSLPELTRDADKIIVPVLPSDIDVHACTRIIADLLLVAKIRRADNRIGVVANRVKRNTLVYRSLQRFLETLNVPVVATLRDSQNYVRSAELGAGIHEMKRHVVADDLAQWQPLIEWLEGDVAAGVVDGPAPWGLPADALDTAADALLAAGPAFGKTAG